MQFIYICCNSRVDKLIILIIIQKLSQHVTHYLTYQFGPTSNENSTHDTANYDIDWHPRFSEHSIILRLNQGILGNSGIPWHHENRGKLWNFPFRAALPITAVNLPIKHTHWQILKIKKIPNEKCSVINVLIELNFTEYVQCISSTHWFYAIFLLI